MKLISPATGYSIGRAARVPSVFSREVGCLDTHLLDEIHADVIDHAAIRSRVQVESTIDGEPVLVGPHSVNGLIRSPETGSPSHLIFIDQTHSRNERRKLNEVAAC